MEVAGSDRHRLDVCSICRHLDPAPSGDTPPNIHRWNKKHLDENVTIIFSKQSHQISVL